MYEYDVLDDVNDGCWTLINVKIDLEMNKLCEGCGEVDLLYNYTIESEYYDHLDVCEECANYFIGEDSNIDYITKKHLNDIFDLSEDPYKSFPWKSEELIPENFTLKIPYFKFFLKQGNDKKYTLTIWERVPKQNYKNVLEWRNHTIPQQLNSVREGMLFVNNWFGERRIKRCIENFRSYLFAGIEY